MNRMSVDTRILERVRKLLTTANSSTGDDDHEAMTALQMAQRMMAKYNIEASDIEELQRDESDVIHIACEHKWDAGYRKALGVIIANNYRCKCYVHGGVIMFIGVREDATIAKAAFEFAYKYIMRRGNQEYEKTRKQGYLGKGVFNSYALGFMAGLKEILQAQTKALMIVTPQTVLNEFDNMDLRKGRGGLRSDGIYKDIYDSGYNDAKDQYSSKSLTSGGNN